MDIALRVFEDALWSGVAAAGFGMLFNVPRQITTLALSLPDDTNMENVREFRIPLETELRHEINVDFGKK